MRILTFFSWIYSRGFYLFSIDFHNLITVIQIVFKGETTLNKLQKNLRELVFEGRVKMQI